jgi:type I restriction enzyme S subunit
LNATFRLILFAFCVCNLHYEKFQDGTVKCIESEIPFEVPEGWQWARLGVLGELSRGKSKHRPRNDSKLFKSGIYPLIQTGDVAKAEGLITEPSSYYNDYGLSQSRMWSKGTLCITIAANIADTAILGIDACFPDSVVGFIPYNPISTPMFIMHYLQYCQKNLEKYAPATAQKNINLNILGKLYVPIPPINEQIRITLNIQNCFESIHSIDSNLSDMQSFIEQLKSKIFELAIHGKLIPQNPNDEPASILLERIRGEKEELIKQGKIKRDKKESIIFRGDDNSYYEKIGSNIKSIDNEIPFAIPDEWEYARLKNIWKLISGRDLSPTEYNAGQNGIPYITGASNFTNGHVELVRWTTFPQVITEIGDLLLTCKGTIGEMAFNTFGQSHIARQIMAIRNIYNLNSEYLFLCLQFYIEGIKNVAKGLIPGISREDILDLLLPIPPVNYQNQVISSVEQISKILITIEKNLI